VPLHSPPSPRPRHDQLPESTAKKLGLVIDLDTCDRCRPAPPAVKEWNAGGYSAPLTDQDAHGSDPTDMAQSRAFL